MKNMLINLYKATLNKLGLIDKDSLDALLAEAKQSQLKTNGQLIRTLMEIKTKHEELKQDFSAYVSGGYEKVNEIRGKYNK